MAESTSTDSQTASDNTTNSNNDNNSQTDSNNNDSSTNNDSQTQTTSKLRTNSNSTWRTRSYTPSQNTSKPETTVTNGPNNLAATTGNSQSSNPGIVDESTVVGN
ncbi:hypothetical protein [Limosilactobacillus equigenerosi]|nr:hypothetical protein [Limosilactobacillus equigenerosi]